MLGDDDFEECPLAHLQYSPLLPFEEAQRVVRRYARDGTWRRFPEEWLQANFQLVRLGAPLSLEQVAEQAIDLIVGSKIGHDLQQFIITATTQVTGKDQQPEPYFRRIAEWFVQDASPGHAPMCAAFLRDWAPANFTFKRSKSGITPALMPMVEWLIRNGAAELRATEVQEHQRQGTAPAKHRLLLPILVLAVDEHGRQDLLETSLRYLLLTRVTGASSNTDMPDGLWPQVERALDRGARENLAVDMAHGLHESRVGFPKQAWAPLAKPCEYPAACAALLKGLAGGAFDPPVAQVAWSTAFNAPAPEVLPRFRDRQALLDATLYLRFAIGDQDVDRQHRAGWAAMLTQEVIRLHGGLSEAMRLPQGRHHPIVSLLGWRDDVTIAMVEVLDRALRDSPPSSETRLAQSILEHEISDERSSQNDLKRALRAGACLTALIPSSPPTRAPPPDLTHVAEKLTQLVNQPWFNSHYGVAMGSLLGGRGQVVFEELSNEDKIRLEDERLVLERRNYEGFLQSLNDSEHAMALCVLYFLHELIHIQQGLGDFATVQQVRSTGAEMTLMHLDLSDDHTACLLAHEAFPSWDLLWLKNITGRSLTEFPASIFSTQAARYRKAARLVSIRVDYLARKMKAVDRSLIGDGYLFADYGPAGGHLLIISSASPMRMVKSVPLTSGDADILWRAADPHGHIDQVDSILMQALQ